MAQKSVGQNVFTATLQNPFPSLNIIDDQPLVIREKLQNGTYPKWNMTLKLSLAAKIVAYLRENEGFIRTHKFRNPSKPKPDSDTKDITQDSVVPLSETDQTENAQNPSKRRKFQASGAAFSTIELFKNSPGSYVERCKRHKPEKTTFKVRERKSQGCHCPAQFAIKFQEGYYYADDGSLNVEKFGDMLVKLYWNYNHNHTDFYTTNHHKNIGKLRFAIRMAVENNNNTWRKLVGQKHSWVPEIEETSSPSNQVNIDERRRRIRSLAIKSPIREKVCVYGPQK